MFLCVFVVLASELIKSWYILLSSGLSKAHHPAVHAMLFDFSALPHLYGQRFLLFVFQAMGKLALTREALSTLTWALCVVSLDYRAKQLPQGSIR